jgi:hypothetical protein
MMMTMMRTKLGPAVVFAAAVACVALTARPPVRQKDLPAQASVLRPEVARLIFHSALPLLIDFYWLQAIHTIGASRSSQDSQRLYQYGRFLSEMDPRFYEPYWVIGLNVPWALGREQWLFCDEGIDIYERGLKQFPEDLRLEGYLAWNYLECKKDYRRAAETLKLISSKPGAPSWSWSLATRLYAMSGSVADATALVEDLANQATTDEDKALFTRRLQELQTEQVLQNIDAAIQRYFEEKGLYPATVNDLVGAGYLPGPPVDPNEGELSIGEDHRAHSTSQGRRLEIFVDERARRN